MPLGKSGSGQNVSKGGAGSSGKGNLQAQGKGGSGGSKGNAQGSHQVVLSISLNPYNFLILRHLAQLFSCLVKN